MLAASPELYETCQEEASLLLKLRRGLKPWDEPDFGVETDEALYGLYSRATSAFFIGMIAVVSLSLLIGGIVIMNIMLVAVSERTREIGIGKAVGARRRDIGMQFLVEASALAGAGGLIGVLLGALVASVVNAVSPVPARLRGLVGRGESRGRARGRHLRRALPGDARGAARAGRGAAL